MILSAFCFLLGCKYVTLSIYLMITLDLTWHTNDLSGTVLSRDIFAVALCKEVYQEDFYISTHSIHADNGSHVCCIAVATASRSSEAAYSVVCDPANSCDIRLSLVRLYDLAI